VAGSSLDGKREPLAGCTIMNVPGPAVPLYFDGARMTYFSAIMPIADGMGLVFAVTSYDGMIFISPTSCREQLPDPEFFAQCIRDSFQDLLAVADERETKKKKPAARRAPAKKATNKRKAAAKRRAA
jgi:diacylglycerol O-acyltransferase / wax synthase